MLTPSGMYESVSEHFLSACSVPGPVVSVSRTEGPLELDVWDTGGCDEVPSGRGECSEETHGVRGKRVPEKTSHRQGPL